MDRLFKPREEIVYYKDIDELKRLVKFYLENPEKRRSIIERGRAKVSGSHTWLHRMREVADFINSHA
jgi:spore maturation protein CgeB